MPVHPAVRKLQAQHSETTTAITTSYPTSGNGPESQGSLSGQVLLSQQLIHASIDCMVAMDTEQRILSWNKACTQHSGIEQEAAVGQSFPAFLPDLYQVPVLQEALSRGLKGFKSYLPPEAGCWFPGSFELHIIPLEQEGRVTGVLIIAHDVAHRIKTEQQLKTLNTALQEKYDELERANAELAGFTSLTSNDLKEPLRKIYSLLEKVTVSEARTLTNDSRATLRRAQSFIQRLGLLADSLITFSALQPEALEKVQLSEVVAEALAILRPQLNELKASLHQEPLPEVAGSRQQLRLLFQQLIAVLLQQAGRHTKPVIRIAGLVPPSDAGALPGVLLQLMPLPEAAGAVPDLGAGGSLGLALARKIIANHKGKLLQDPQQNGFSVYLPAAR